MLLGLWGPFGCGKTFFMGQMLKEMEGRPEFKHVVIVMADLSREYHLDFPPGCYVEAKGKDDHWKGKQADKEPFIEEMMGDDTKLWVVESARYFSGMYGTLVRYHERYGGGVRMIIPITTGPIMETFLRARCEKRNKRYNAEYWDPKRIEYEADRRYTNPTKNVFKPVGIPFNTIYISQDRHEFAIVRELMWQAIRLPVAKWYPTPLIKMPKLVRGYV